MILPTLALVALAPSVTAASPRDAVARALAYTVAIEGGDTYGSGVLMAPAEGLVVTNLHVVEHMSAPRATFADGTSVTARLVDADRALDLALLSVPPQPARPAPDWGDATAMRPGDEVYAVGCPLRLSFTVSRGIVSFVGRALDAGGARYLQTDVPVNDGNSGGPLINARGELVGLVTFVLPRAQGLTFALPVERLARYRRWRH
jgi:S1-C subfamily serine protease